MTSELQQLCATLDGLRAGVLKKLAGLSDEDARERANSRYPGSATVPRSREAAGRRVMQRC